MRQFHGQETHLGKQPIVFLKVGFSKAYMIKLIGIFSFKCMKGLGISIEFVIMTQMLFLKAPIYILVNG
jgi:hypothetical protein